MPTLSASDYTQYLKMKAAAGTGIRPAIQTRDNVTLSQSVLNANILTSQSAFVTNKSITSLGNSLNYVRPPPTNFVNNPKNLSSLSWGGTTSSSKFQQPGGLPANGKVGDNYTRLPQNAGWIQGGADNVSSGQKRF